MTHAEIQERLALFAVGDLDGVEGEEISLHVAQCDACTAEVLELEEAFGAMALSAAPVEPSAALRDRVLAAMKEGSTEREPSRGRDSSRRPASAPRRARVGAAGWLGGAVAAAAAAFLLWSDWTLRAERDRLLAELEKVETRAESAERELVATRAQAETAEMELAEARRRAESAFVALARERAAATVVSDPQTTEVSLGGEEHTPKARGRIAVNAEESRAVLFCDGMPPPPAGMAYQLWFITGGKPVPGGVFHPAPDGTCLFPDRMPPEARGADVFAVTLEPASGVPAPTGKMFLVSAAAP